MLQLLIIDHHQLLNLPKAQMLGIYFFFLQMHESICIFELKNHEKKYLNFKKQFNDLQNIFITQNKLFKIFRIDIYFDNNVFRKAIHQAFEYLEVRWFYNGINIKASQKYSIAKNKEVSTLQINQMDFSDAGIYAIQVFARNSQPLATLNIQSF